MRTLMFLTATVCLLCVTVNSISTICVGNAVEEITSNEEDAETDKDNEEPDETNRIITNFGVIVRSAAFVDKTLLIKVVLECDRSILVTAPASFGKSASLSMLKAFLEIQTDRNGHIRPYYYTDNYRLFIENRLTISQYSEIIDQHLGRYSVIYANFQQNYPSSHNDSINNRYYRAIRESFRDHSYLLHSSKLNETDRERFRSWYDHNENERCDSKIVENGLTLLSTLLRKHYDRTKVMILLDDYDDPLLQVLLKSHKDPELLSRAIELSRKIISNVFETNDFGRVFITAVSYIACSVSGLFDTANLLSYRFLDDENPFTDFYGLTDAEVDNLLASKETTAYDSLVDKTDVRKAVRLRFNGYETRHGSKRIYNTACVTHLLNVKSFDAVFWPITEAFLTVRRLLNVDAFRNGLATLLEDKPLTISTTNATSNVWLLNHLLSDDRHSLLPNVTNVNIYYEFLLEQGYLTATRRSNQSDSIDSFDVKIPNEEVKRKFINFLAEYYNVDMEIIQSQYASASKFL